ncbi:MAG: triacylglycerol lipase [Pseudomonadales bacterium]|nr:triacylglycerol lipase [Pseudomonadales bacterium]
MSRKTLVFLSLLLSMASSFVRASESYYQCTPSGCSVEGTEGVASNYDATRYPIVLVHGLFGAGSYFGLLDYFYQIPQGLAANGARVFVPQLSAANATSVRGEQLLTQVKYVLAITGASKVNLIGHSQGGPTARYVAGVAPNLVASVTTVAGVNAGSSVADAIEGVTDIIGPLGTSVVTGIVNAFSGLIDPNEGQNSQAALYDLTTAGTTAFNKQFPGGVPSTKCGSGNAQYNGVKYYSWSGNASYTGDITTGIDPTDAVTGLGNLTFFGAANDGLVSSCSSHLGVVIRDNYYQNHFDEVNQLAGLISPFTTSPVTLFKSQGNRLRNNGL